MQRLRGFKTAEFLACVATIFATAMSIKWRETFCLTQIFSLGDERLTKHTDNILL